MKVFDICEFIDQEFQDKENSLVEEFFILCFQQVMGQFECYGVIKQIKKDLVCVFMVLCECKNND